MKSGNSCTKRNQMLFYDNRYSILGRALNRLSNMPMLFYDKRLISLIAVSQSQEKLANVLDVGTGQGVDAILLSENCDEVVAVDISKKALLTAKLLAQLKKAQKSISLVQSDAEHLPFRDEIFDAVCCKDVLHHVSNAVVSMREMKRVARENANVIAVEANALNPQMIAIGLIYYSVDSGVFKNTSSRIANLFLKVGFGNVRLSGRECFPRHVFFEYRSPLNRFLDSHCLFMLRLLASIETRWQKHTFLSKFSNYIVVSGSKQDSYV